MENKKIYRSPEIFTLLADETDLIRTSIIEEDEGHGEIRKW